MSDDSELDRLRAIETAAANLFPNIATQCDQVTTAWRSEDYNCPLGVFVGADDLRALGKALSLTTDAPGDLAWYTLARLSTEGSPVPFSVRQDQRFKERKREYDRIVESQRRLYPRGDI